MNHASQTLETAFQYHMAGNLDQARSCYEQVVSQQQHHGAALHGLAMIACAQHHFDQAVDWAQQAVDAQPDMAHFYNTLGISYDATGRKDKAMQAFHRAVTLKPDHAEAFHNLGICLQSQKEYTSAIDQCRKAITIKPQLAKAHVTMAQCFQAKGDSAQATHAYEQAIRIDPTLMNAYIELAQLYEDQNRLDCAANALQHILQLAPGHAPVHTRLAATLRQLGHDAEAAQHYEQALRIDPDFAEAHNNYGNLLHHHNQYEQALHHYERATQCNDTYAEAFNNLAATLIRLGRLNEAVTQCHKAIALKPAYAEAHNTLASALMFMGRYQEAIEGFKQTLALTPAYAEAHSNLGMMYLVNEDFTQGWQEYEWRLNNPGFIRRYSAPQPRWDGSPFKGKTLLVHYEQGMGDSIQFVRYVPQVKALGGTVIYQDRPALKPLLSRMPGVDRFVTTQEALPDFDLQVSVMSLPFLFKTDSHTIPSTTTYLRAEVDRIKTMRSFIHAHDFNVGIVWAGSKVHKNNKNRSCDPALFRTLTQCPDIGLYALQKPDADDPVMPDSLKTCLVANLGEHFQDFSDTAGAIAHMDLVITVDTSVLHLASAMGKPTWGLIPFVPDWRWQLERTDSPWYPTLRLFRQNAPGQWRPVFEAVTQTLIQTVQQHRSR